ncbi:hypothetical protein PQR70_36450 [Paraburkholderia madseniana]
MTCGLRLLTGLVVPNGTSGRRPSHAVFSCNVPGNASDHRSLRAASSGRVINKGDAQSEEDTASEFHHDASPEMMFFDLHRAKTYRRNKGIWAALREVDLPRRR